MQCARSQENVEFKSSSPVSPLPITDETFLFIASNNRERRRAVSAFLKSPGSYTVCLLNKEVIA